MYGIVNKALEALVREHYGEGGWQDVKMSGGIDIDYFLSNERYPDEITYRLISAISNRSGKTSDEVLATFGEWWVLRTVKENYGGLMAAGGSTLKEFLINLPVFHNRVMLIYPKLSPPEFKVSDLSDDSIHVHYLSARQGLEFFVVGLLQGLAKMYKTEAVVSIVKSKTTGHSHAVFKVRW